MSDLIITPPNLPLPHYQRDQHSHYESSNVRPDRHTSAMHSHPDPAHSLQELDHEPISQDQDRRHGNQKYKEEGQYPVPRIKHRIRSHHAADRSARANRRYPRIQIKQHMDQPRTYAAEQIKDQ